MKLENIPQRAPTTADLFNEFLWCAQQVERTARAVRVHMFKGRKEPFTHRQAGSLGDHWERQCDALIEAAYELPVDNFTALLLWVFMFDRHHDFTCHKVNNHVYRVTMMMSAIQERVLKQPNGWTPCDDSMRQAQQFFNRVARTRRRRDWSDQLTLLKLAVN